MSYSGDEAIRQDELERAFYEREEPVKTKTELRTFADGSWSIEAAEPDINDDFLDVDLDQAMEGFQP